MYLDGTELDKAQRALEERLARVGVDMVVDVVDADGLEGEVGGSSSLGGAVVSDH